MRRLFTLLALICLTGPIYADYYGEWGIGFQHPTGDQISDRLKMVEFGYTRSHAIFESTFAIGGWVDLTTYPGALNSAYVKALIGLETRQPGVYLNYFVGPALLSTPDILLGSHFEIAHEFGIGWKDSRGVAIGFIIQHLSDGGLSVHNFGRNFVGVRARC